MPVIFFFKISLDICTFITSRTTGTKNYSRSVSTNCRMDISNASFTADKRAFVFKNFWYSGRQLSGGHRTLNKFSQDNLNFSPTLFLPRDAGHIGHRNCSTFVWPRRTFRRTFTHYLFRSDKAFGYPKFQKSRQQGGFFKKPFSQEIILNVCIFSIFFSFL